MLLEHVLACPRSWLLAHDTDPLAAEAVTRFLQLQSRRVAGEPMAYLVGTREFMGHTFEVAPGVLIPRPDTELLVETALAYGLAQDEAIDVLDMGTGSGAIAISLALARVTFRVTATDVSAQALAIARDNAHRLGATVRWLSGSWFGALGRGEKFDLIVSNPPYIAQDDPHLSEGDLRFEPSGALTDGGDGLSDLRILIQGAPDFLKPGGALWVEHGWRQAGVVRELLLSTGFTRVASRRDLSGIERISGGYL